LQAQAWKRGYWDL